MIHLGPIHCIHHDACPSSVVIALGVFALHWARNEKLGTVSNEAKSATGASYQYTKGKSTLHLMR